MARRLMGSLVGGILGGCVGYQYHQSMGLSTQFAFVGLLLTGMAIGWAASILIDVFVGDSGKVASR